MSRDFVHIDDVARAFASAIRVPADGSRILDIGGGVATPVLHVAALIAELAGAPEPTVSGRFRDGDIRHAWCTLEDATAALDWSPVVDWRTGITEYANWYRKLAAGAGGAR
jgi:dTDP-L-rhamnose 4-epimerase